MAKFKVGDRVVGNEKAEKYGITRKGWHGRVIGIDPDVEGGETDICVKGKDIFDEVIKCWVSSLAFDLESEKSDSSSKPDDRAKKRDGRPCKRRVVIEITDDGATAEYIVGKDHEKGVSITRHKKDKPDDYRAAIYAVAKLFDRKVDINDGDYFSLTEREVRDLEDSLKNAQGYLDDAKAIVNRNAVRK